MDKFEREIIPYENHFWDFYNKLDPKVQDKFDWTISLIERTKIVPKQHFDHITGTDGVWEIRVKTGSNIFRVFCFLDKGNLILLLNGFQKKNQKTPINEIIRAQALKKKYYENN
ncbi:MAG: type II toxin-antitoxin system RelE/ParE family toxin [Flavobacteriales bacterium]|nr:type II toxin-antitoxin system RelE/ParE family toxin [Flavobacteriales bacterium]